MSSRVLETPVPLTMNARHLTIGASLVTVYVIWGGTFLAIRVALDSFPPMLSAASRFLLAGLALFVVARIRGESLPNARQWGACAALGVLFVASNAAVVYAEETVPTNVAAMVLATIPMWAALLGHLWGERTRGREWIGLAFGLAGVAILHFGGALGASTLGALVLFAAPVAWAFGTIWSRHVSLPGGMMQNAVQMTMGGAVVLGVSFARGERMTAFPSGTALAALAYLVVFGSIIAFSAYTFLVREVRPSVATSYAYVNPIVALALGATFGGEHITATSIIALALTLAGVLLLAKSRARSRNPPAEPRIATSR